MPDAQPCQLSLDDNGDVSVETPGPALVVTPVDAAEGVQIGVGGDPNTDTVTVISDPSGLTTVTVPPNLPLAVQVYPDDQLDDRPLPVTVPGQRHRMYFPNGGTIVYAPKGIKKGRRRASIRGVNASMDPLPFMGWTRRPDRDR
jgi:hypothetical protein